MTNSITEKGIESKLTAFEQEGYTHQEYLNELLRFQNQIINVTFPQNPSTDSMNISSVVNYLAEKNESLGNPADEELHAFRKDCWNLTNCIDAQLSGQKGEEIVYSALKHLHCEHAIIRNLEMTDGEHTTEIDALVITEKGITIVEVKNTHRNIFIDSEGNYYKTGEFLRFDCNIGWKMNFRRTLIENALKEAGFAGIPVQGLVVFTNPRIEVQNHCRTIKTCFVSQLTSLIENQKSKERLSSTAMEYIERSIERRGTHETYVPDFDADRMKNDFAVIMVKLQDAEEASSNTWHYRLKNFILNMFSFERAEGAARTFAR